jgi:hypothetical protein
MTILFTGFVRLCNCGHAGKKSYLVADFLLEDGPVLLVAAAAGEQSREQ